MTKVKGPLKEGQGERPTSPRPTSEKIERKKKEAEIGQRPETPRPSPPPTKGPER